MTRTSVTLLSAAGLIFAWTLNTHATPAKTQAEQILEVAGVKAGLCVHLGCGAKNNPALTAELAAGSNFLVHGLALDDAALDRTRKAIEAKGLAGRATAEKTPINPLPYLRDLANLVVIEDWPALTTQGLTTAEVERIVAPGGVICARKAGRWSRSVKPRPPEMDDWPQPAHGPDGNRVSADRVVKFPSGLRWQDGMPMNFNMWAACRGWVIANGRCFTLSTTELENLAPAAFAKHKLEQYVTARDAFNGLPLWKLNCETLDDGKALNAFNTAPIVADDHRVYVYKKDRLVGLDAVTGAVAVSCAVKHQTVRLLLSQNVLVSSGWEAKTELKQFDRGGLWAPWVNKTGAGAVEVFDAASGAAKWSVPTPAQEMVAADGVVYLLLQSGNPPTGQQIVAVDLQTGRERWRVEHTQFEPATPMNLNCAGLGVLSIARPKAKTISILSAADGKVLWEIKPASRFWTPLVDGMLWHESKKYNPKTGEVKGVLPASIDSPMCTPAAVVGNYVTASRGCSYLELTPSPEGAAFKGSVTRISYGAARGGCIEGATPALGMFFTGQNFCRCAPGQVPGFVAFGPSGDPPTAGEFEKPRPVEQGPAFGKIQNPRSTTQTPGDWPTYRHDAERSGATKGAIPEKLKLLWQREAARPPTGPLAAAWQARLISCLSAPVVADGMVFAAATDASQVVSLNAATGKPLWRATVGGRLDSPPTIHGGLCLIGSHDGWVYALRARDGQLVWRVRIAPWERRMVAFGAVESVWPAPGSVLVHDGVLFASAGRSSESDGGLAVCALDPASGQQLWAREVGPGPVRENNLLAARDGKIKLHHLQFDPKTGQGDVAAKGERDAPLEALMDGSWTRMGTRRSGGHKFGRASAEIFCWNENTVFGYESKSRSCYALERAKTAGAEKLTRQDYAWRQAMPTNHQAEAMALSDNALVVAGRVCDAGTVSGFLALVLPKDGRIATEYPLETPPVYDSLALAGQRVFLTLQNGKALCFGKSE
ncbi:MAG: PQQ-binding-like beta-propeller repeat protein [Verrucomicrobia bacterium]|nr:PQQ-binding-like beta-propeller repeat protein [Verrucomicrobiota bacterium]